MSKTLRTCPKGHQYYKASDCPACPVCEQENKPETGLLSMFASPVRRALAALNISTPEQLAQYSEQEILRLHGIGPSSLPKMREALQAAGLAFRE